MRVAALYDIHANLPALQAVLAEPDIAAADVVVVGGDALAGPMPAETLALLTALGDRAEPGARNSAPASCGTGAPPGRPAGSPPPSWRRPTHGP